MVHRDVQFLPGAAAALTRSRTHRMEIGYDEAATALQYAVHLRVFAAKSGRSHWFK